MKKLACYLIWADIRPLKLSQFFNRNIVEITLNDTEANRQVYRENRLCKANRMPSISCNFTTLAVTRNFERVLSPHISILTLLNATNKLLMNAYVRIALIFNFTNKITQFISL